MAGDGTIDQALIDAIEIIKDMAPNFKETIKDIATLKQQMINIETNTTKQFDMLSKLQESEVRIRRERLKVWGAFGLALLTAIGNMVIAYFQTMHK